MEPMSQESIDDDAALREELVAYLDHELSVEQGQRIEQRLRVEPRAQRMLQDFDRTWGMLDELEPPRASEDFTRTTLEMVAFAAADDVAQAKADAPRRRRRTLLWTLAGLAGAAAAGFLLVWRLAPDPNAQLLQDLPLLEDYDQYREVGSIEFLRALYKEKLFAKETSGGTAATGSASEKTLVERRQEVQAMNADQQENLFRNEQAYRDPNKTDEQQRIRKLHADIQGDPDHDKLMATMNRYCKWFEEQPPPWRWDLQQKSTNERVAEVKQQREKEKSGGKLDPKNRRAVARWMDSYVTDHEHDSRFVNDVLKEWLRGGRGPGSQRGAIFREGDSPTGRFAELPANKKHSVLWEMVLRGWQTGNPLVHPTDAELATLRASLSTDSRERLEKKKPDEQTRIIAGWLRQTASLERDAGLVDYFEKVLTTQERDRLMSLPGDEFDRELGHLYMAYLMRADQPFRGDRPRPNRQRPIGPRSSGGPRWPGGPSPDSSASIGRNVLPSVK